MDIPEHDIIIVGAGNAATCAALSATENGASVLQLEISPEAARGGNSAFTGGAFRVVYHGFDDLAQLIPDINDHELSTVDVGTYTAEQYFDDIGRLTEYRCDPDLSEILITRSFDTARWMREKGVRFQLGLGRQAFRVDGKFKFWGGLACHIWGGGKELIKALASRADREQIRVLYDTPAVALLQGEDGVAGVRVRHQGRLVDLRSRAVVSAPNWRGSTTACSAISESRAAMSGRRPTSRSGGRDAGRCDGVRAVRRAALMDGWDAARAAGVAHCAGPARPAAGRRPSRARIAGRVVQISAGLSRYRKSASGEGRGRPGRHPTR